MSGTVLLCWSKVIILVLVLSRMVSANCTDDQILKYFTSSKLPWDNYRRISKAVFPPSRSPSLLIKIRVKFVNESSADVCDKDTRETDKNYTWSMACLYVSGGSVSMFAMNVFSLGTIWPNRRETELCIKLPLSCRRDLEDKNEENLKYFLSKVGMVYQYRRGTSAIMELVCVCVCVCVCVRVCVCACVCLHAFAFVQFDSELKALKLNQHMKSSLFFFNYPYFRKQEKSKSKSSYISD